MNHIFKLQPWCSWIWIWKNESFKLGFEALFQRLGDKRGICLSEIEAQLILIMSSPSNWLDRLWSSKAHHHAHSNNSIPITTTPPQQPSNPFTRITHSLSDLFCVAHPTIPNPMPPSSFPTARKFPRKQPTPVHYILSKSSDSHLHTGSDGGDRIAAMNNVSVSPGINELTVHDDQVKFVENPNNAAQEEEDTDEGCPSIDGFSRTEVTVIDTSLAGWKCEKFLFRKDATWKARNNKGNKATVALRKKIKNKEKKRKSLDMPMENFEHKKLKVLFQGSSMIKTGRSGCNELNEV